jgi:hypothetical protein
MNDGCEAEGLALGNREVTIRDIDAAFHKMRKWNLLFVNGRDLMSVTATATEFLNSSMCQWITLKNIDTWAQ